MAAEDEQLLQGQGWGSLRLKESLLLEFLPLFYPLVLYWGLNAFVKYRLADLHSTNVPAAANSSLCILGVDQIEKGQTEVRMYPEYTSISYYRKRCRKQKG